MSTDQLLFSFAFSRSQGERDMQEDYAQCYMPHPKLPLFCCLADGMGGHADGEKASRCVVEAFLDFIENQFKKGETAAVNEAAVESLISNALRFAEQTLQSAKDAGKIGADAGCTFLVACLRGSRATFCSVGDSLIYIQDNSGLHWINRKDLDTKGNELDRLAEGGQISYEEAAKHPMRRALMQAVLGSNKPCSPHFRSYGLQEGDRVLLASDGMLPLIPDEESSTELDRILEAHPVPNRSLYRYRAGGKEYESSGCPQKEFPATFLTQCAARDIVTNVLNCHTPNQDNVTVLLIDVLSQFGVKKVRAKITSKYPRRAPLAAVACTLLCLICGLLLYKEFPGVFQATEATSTTEPTKTVEPTETKTVKPTETKTVKPTETKTVEPTETKTVEPTETKTVEPTQQEKNEDAKYLEEIDEELRSAAIKEKQDFINWLMRLEIKKLGEIRDRDKNGVETRVKNILEVVAKKDIKITFEKNKKVKEGDQKLFTQLTGLSNLIGGNASQK